MRRKRMVYGKVVECRKEVDWSSFVNGKECKHPKHVGDRMMPVAAFTKNAQNPDGLHKYCQVCRNRDRRKWIAENPDKVREANKKQRLKREGVGL